ncbi:MAG: hypothetical protein QM708_07925 [Propioniciclava sp.]|uniref:hypothetical protein n=1 Tax=Propioniciclava sp. TaxID=2038686 RepID=UPI0039E6EB6F
MASVTLAGALCAVAPGAAVAAPQRTTPIAGSAGFAATRAQGTIAVELDGSTLTATPVGSRACRLRVDATLRLTGTLAGSAPGITTAIIDAPCDQALATPPGTFADVFQFTGTFTGTVHGRTAIAHTSYAGVTRAGGQVTAGLALHGGASAAALVKAKAAGVGTYQGHALP